MKPFASPAVAQAFAAYPPAVRKTLLIVRTLILEAAATIEGVGPLEETLKWNEPAYLTEQSGSGSTIRLGWKKARPDRCAVYFICHTHLVDTFRAMFPRELQCEGNRAIVFKPGETLDKQVLTFCIAAALTYHRDSKQIARA